MNKVLLTGNLVNIRTSTNPNGNLNAFVTIAPAIWRKKTNQNQKSIFVTVNFFDVSENYIENLKKARILSIEGHISVYNQKVTEEKTIKSISIISDRCQILLYKKSKLDDQNDFNQDFKLESEDLIFEEKTAKSDNKKPPYSSDGEIDTNDETIFLNDDGGLF